jgi:hypothetical protein
MNSLRTDDILGAKPRVRHMPLNLIRERKIPISFLANIHPTNPEYDENRYNDLPDSKSNYYSPIQYQNSDASSYPFLARNRLTK